MTASLAMLIAALFVGAACTSARTADEQMYEASPAELAGAPGTIIRVAPMPGLAVAGTAYRVLYRSRGLADEPIAVSGVVMVPPGPPPTGGRDVVAWAHPTTGVVQACAPSQRAQLIAGIPGLADMLARGYLVAATDYPGLGTPGPHPYVIGVSEGRAVLDAVRARALRETHAGRRVVIWGHSQGGHAALYAGELARSYAPELDLLGVAAAAPATFLADLVEHDLDTAKGRILGAMALYSWSRVFGYPLNGNLEPAALPAFKRTAERCFETPMQAILAELAELPLQRHFLKSNPARTEPWRSIMLRNSPGQAAAGAPVFLAQGTADVTVPPPITEQFMAGLCQRGTPSQLVVLPGVDHHSSAHAVASVAVDWMADRFAGAPPPTDCRR